MKEKNTDNPLITVITISYNAVSVIEETIKSVINQDYQNVEYIIIDGGSTDGTVDIIKKYQNYLSYWVSEPDKGIYDAMNKGLRMAHGAYANFMNSGDCFYTKHSISDVFKQKRVADVIYGDNVLQYKWGEIILAPDKIERIMEYMPFGHQTTFVKTELLKKYGFDCSFKIAADYNFFYILYAKKCLFEYLPIPISIVDATEGVSKEIPSVTYIEDARITGRDKLPLWEIKYNCFKVRLAIRSLVIRCISPSWIENRIRENILRNKLIKKVYLK